MTYEQEKLVGDNYKLIWHVIHKNPHLLIACNKDDLVSEGHMALIMAAKTFKNDKRIKFSTYGCKCIYNRLSRLNQKRSKEYGKTLSIDDDFECDTSKTEKLYFIDTLVSNDYSELNKKYDMDYYFIALEYTLLKYCTPMECTIMIMKLLGKTQREMSDVVKVSQAQCSRLLNQVIDKLQYVVHKDVCKNYKGIIKSDYIDTESYLKVLYKNLRGKLKNGTNRTRAKSTRKNNESYTKEWRLRV